MISILSFSKLCVHKILKYPIQPLKNFQGHFKVFYGTINHAEKVSENKIIFMETFKLYVFKIVFTFLFLKIKIFWQKTEL